VFALVATNPLAGATTWIVDVNNGPGTDFTQISAAIAAVSAGDTLLVLPGQYTGFVLDKPLAIVGLGTAPTNEATVYNMTLQDLPAGTTTVIANLFANGVGFGGVVIQDCPGAVMIDDLGSYDHVEVANCVDVRFRRLDAQASMLCLVSRVEIADSSVAGAIALPCTCCDGPGTIPSQPGLRVAGGEVHLARSSVLGGHGSSDFCIDPGGCDGNGGAGGTGIVLESGARLLVAGDAQQFVEGGGGGVTDCFGGHPGAMGAALIVSGGCEARLSGEALIGAVQNLGGAITTATPDDPTTNALGAPMAGTIFTLRVHGPPGATADVILGRHPILVSTPELDEEEMTPVNRVFHLGIIPANGTASLNYPVSPVWQKGFDVVFQGRVTYTDSSVHYTNSVPTIVQ
jgi:hypothetical protein